MDWFEPVITGFGAVSTARADRAATRRAVVSTRGPRLTETCISRGHPP